MTSSNATTPVFSEEPVATKKEWDAMNSINPHFTFRERTAFLVGFRLGRADALEEARGIVGTSVCCDDACMRGDDCIKGRIDSRLYARLAAKEGK